MHKEQPKSIGSAATTEEGNKETEARASGERLGAPARIENGAHQLWWVGDRKIWTNYRVNLVASDIDWKVRRYWRGKNSYLNSYFTPLCLTYYFRCLLEGEQNPEQFGKVFLVIFKEE